MGLSAEHRQADAWNAEAAAYDDEPDHGLRDPVTREAWRRLLLDVLPTPPARVADLGCGTGSLAVLLAAEGYAVHGLDLAERMLDRARSKADRAGVEVTFTLGSAERPPLPAGSFDVVLSRHVLWTMPDPADAMGRWCELLAPGARLVLIEGQWFTGGGLSTERCAELVRAHREQADVRLLPDRRYWGRRVDDERYLLLSRR